MTAGAALEDPPVACALVSIMGALRGRRPTHPVAGRWGDRLADRCDRRLRRQPYGPRRWPRSRRSRQCRRAEAADGGPLAGATERRSRSVESLGHARPTAGRLELYTDRAIGDNPELVGRVREALIEHHFSKMTGWTDDTGPERFRVDLDRHSYHAPRLGGHLHRSVGEPGDPAGGRIDRRDRLRHRIVHCRLRPVRPQRARLRHLAVVHRRRQSPPRRPRLGGPRQPGRISSRRVAVDSRASASSSARRHRAALRPSRTSDD